MCRGHVVSPQPMPMIKMWRRCSTISHASDSSRTSKILISTGSPSSHRLLPTGMDSQTESYLSVSISQRRGWEADQIWHVVKPAVKPLLRIPSDVNYLQSQQSIWMAIVQPVKPPTRSDQSAAGSLPMLTQSYAHFCRRRPDWCVLGTHAQ